ncbi:two-component sensor histidine kinase [Salipaludibacillus neizhouensis]|uniref:Two-component sensor histidine kinase n=1 Tax=Salipaludibacillus neizhouensis TaxID=885475 RepID=A0A3A9KC11_9BACI|nr:sensor histidine kinase [Salipaludibacillus neizhouensis]RKL64885.1 two-component sensor histidine kinase [Salipaludibacillus neizhouensis]
MRLKHKLISSYLIALIVPIMIITLTIYNLTAKSLEDSARLFASMYTSQARTTMDEFIMEYDQMTKSVLAESHILQILEGKTLVTMEQRIQDKELIQNFLIRMVNLKPEIDTVMLIGSNQDVYRYTRTSVSIDEKILLSQPWLKELKNSKKNLFITPAHEGSYYNNGNKGAVVTVGRKLSNYSGSYVGMILMELEPQKLIKLNEDFLMARNQYDIRLVMSNDNGEIIYHSDVTTDRRDWSEIIGEEYVVEENQEAKDDLIVLSDSSNIGEISLSTEIPKDKLLANINRIRYVTLFATMGCVLFVVIVSVIFSHRITKPILYLRRSMKLAEIGQYVPLTDSSLRKDEIGELVESYNQMILRIKELIEDVFIAEIKQKQAKFLALQTQINPHMLYNTLEQIRMKAFVENQDEIADMIKILARLFKLSLGKETGNYTIRNEIDYVSNYIKLQNMRYEDRFLLKLQLNEEIMNTPVFPIVLQPIVENSITHGFRYHNTILTIRIEGKIVEQNDVLIRIADNGVSMPLKQVEELNKKLQFTKNEKTGLRGMQEQEEENRDSDKSIGLVNIAQRIKLHYGERYGMKLIPQTENGVTVEILIPKYSKNKLEE